MIVYDNRVVQIGLDTTVVDVAIRSRTHRIFTTDPLSYIAKRKRTSRLISVETISSTNSSKGSKRQIFLSIFHVASLPTEVSRHKTLWMKHSYKMPSH